MLVRGEGKECSGILREERRQRNSPRMVKTFVSEFSCCRSSPNQARKHDLPCSYEGPHPFGWGGGVVEGGVRGGGVEEEEESVAIAIGYRRCRLTVPRYASKRSG